MNTCLTPVLFEGKPIRTSAGNDSGIWYVLTDILKAIGTSSTPGRAAASVTENIGDGVIVDHPTRDTLGREQLTTLIHVDAVTFLVSRSNTDTGKRLRKFIYGEVMPSIRQHGRYPPPTAYEADGLLTNKIAEGLDLLGKCSKEEQARHIKRAIRDNACFGELLSDKLRLDVSQFYTRKGLAKRAGCSDWQIDYDLNTYGFLHYRRLTEKGQQYAAGTEAWSVFVLDAIKTEKQAREQLLIEQEGRTFGALPSRF